MHHARGLRRCVIEVAPDPIAENWVRLPGIGFRVTLANYPPGKYWVHAAATRAGEQGEWTEPVYVIVK